MTFAFREAVFALAMMEDELFAKDARSNIIQVLEDVMARNTAHWGKYYRGSEIEQLFKRKYSFSDRLRYYWPEQKVEHALGLMLRNLKQKPLPLSLLSQFMPAQYERVRQGLIQKNVDCILLDRVRTVLYDYQMAE